MEADTPPHISGDEIRNIPEPELREKVLSLFDEYERQRDIASRSQRNQVELEQEIFEIQQQNENLEKKLAESVQNSKDQKEQLRTLESERVERTRRLFELEALHDKSESEKAQLKRQCEQFTAEKTSLSEVIDRKNEDLEMKKGEIAGLKEELRGLVTQLCEFQLKQGDLESREIAIEHRENRLKEERELLLQEKEWLQDELRQRDVTVQQLRKENSKQALEHQTSVAAKDDELRETKSALENSKSQCSRFSEQLEKLNKKMKEAADSQVLKDESYEKELQCQIRLAQAYKQAADEAECKVEELAASLETVQELFNETKEQHFSVQEQMKQIRTDFEKEMKEKDDTISELRDELEKANELLRSKHRVMLTDEEVAALSPAAAAASKLMKSGVTLTQIYREHMKTVEELEMQKLETKRIEGYFRELVQDIESKAPLLRKQQEDYGRSLTVIDNMKRQLGEVAKDQQNMINEKDTLMRQLTYTRAELERYQRDNADMASQVRELVWCVEKMRAGEVSVTPLEVTQQPSAEDMLLFRNIDELQGQNQRLLSALREAEARREEMVKAAQEAEMSKIRAEIERTMKEVEELRNQREKQNQLLESIRDERDTYKRMLNRAEWEKDSAKEKVAIPAESEASGAQNVLEKLRVEFEVYRNQKNETEKMLQDKIDKYETMMGELRSSNAKLNAEVEYQLERFKILNGNVETYKKEIQSLQVRNEKTATVLAKHEQKVEHLTNELMSQSEELSRLRVENGRLQEQNQTARNHEQMAQRELELLRKNQHTQQMVSSALQELDTRLKRREAEDTLKMKSDLEALTRERNNLQSNIKTLTEQSQEYVRECKAKITSLEAKVTDEQRQVEHLRAQLQWTEEQLQNANTKTQEFKGEMEKLQLAYQDASGGRFQKEAQQLQTRLNYLEIRHTEANKKIEELTEALNAAKMEMQNYQKMTSSLEGGLKEHKETSQVERDWYEKEISKYKSDLERALADNEGHMNEIAILRDSLNKIQQQANENQKSWNSRVQELETALASTQSEIEEWKKREQELRSDRDNLASSLQEFREKFEQESVAHETSREAQSATQEQLREALSQLNVVQSNFANLTSEFENQKSSYEQRENDISTEMHMANERLQEAQKQNETLLNEIERLMAQVAMFERLSGATSGGEEHLEVVSADISSAEQTSASAIMEVVRCLRREKQQTAEANDYLEAEMRRLKSREQMMEKEMTTLKGELETVSAEAAVAASAAAEKSRLLTQLASLQTVQSVNDALREENESLNNSVTNLRHEIEEYQRNVSELASQVEGVRVNLRDAKAEVDSSKQEASVWQQRYQELLNEKSKFEPEEVSQLRKTVDEYMHKISDYEQQINETKSNYDNAMRQLEELKGLIKSSEEKQKELQSRVDETERRLTQTRHVALKYRTTCQEGEAREQTLRAELESLQEMQQKMEMEKKEMEARCAALELRSREAALSVVEPGSEAANQIQELLAQVEDLKKKELDMKKSLANTGQLLVSAQSDKKQLEQSLNEMKEEHAKMEQVAEERKFRLDSLTSLHSQCDNKLQKLMAQLNSVTEQYQNEKAAWDKQAQDAKATSRAAPVQLVSAMPAGVVTPQPERSSPGGNHHEQRTAPVRPSRQLPVVVSVRPVASQRSTAPVLPTAVSPGPSYPDQSSAVSSLPSIPISVSPTIISSTQPSSSGGVPQAVVPPHIELGHGAVTGSSDPFGGDISSSVVITVGTSEASASTTEPEAPVVVNKRRPPQDPSDRSVKRSRASSPEQVSTSDQRAPPVFGALPILPEEIVESGAGVQAVVDSSLDDQSDDVIFVEEVERGIEPESTGQEQGFDDSRSRGESVAATASDAGPSRPMRRQQQSTGTGHLMAGVWDMGDDGIVPSTPTLAPRRVEHEMGGAAHVPQQRFSFPAFIQEPFPTTHAATGPPTDITAHRSVPTTPRVATPIEADREPASSSTVMDIANIGGDQQPQPSGQVAEPEIIETMMSGEEEADGSSEAVAAKAETERDPEGVGDDDSNEPTTSQPRSSRIRLNLRRAVGEETQTSGTSSPASFTEPATSTVSGPRQTARRGRRGRGGGTGSSRGGQTE